MIVRNMTGASGKEVPNQFIIEDNSGARYFQSYKSIIVKVYLGKVMLDNTYYDYSKTTSKYRNLFLGEDTKTIRRKIKSGEYQLCNLNI